MITQLIIAMLLAIFLHEIGHVLFGEAAGFKFEIIAFGPIKMMRNDNKVIVSENTDWSLFGGVTRSYPEKKSSIRKRLLIYTLGGPVISLFLSGLFYIISLYFETEFITYLAIFNFIIFLSTILPINLADGFETDGASIQKLLKYTVETKEYIHNFLLDSELISSKFPRDWDKDILKDCEQRLNNRSVYSDDDSKQLTFVFYYYSDTKEKSQLNKSLNELIEKVGLENNENMKSSLYSSYILFDFLEEQDIKLLEKMKRLFEAISENDGILFYRSLAIINYLENNNEGMELAIKNAETDLELLNNHKYGYLKLENEWFCELKKVLTNNISNELFDHN